MNKKTIKSGYQYVKFGNQQRTSINGKKKPDKFLVMVGRKNLPTFFVLIVTKINYYS